MTNQTFRSMSNIVLAPLNPYLELILLHQIKYWSNIYVIDRNSVIVKLYDDDDINATHDIVFSIRVSEDGFISLNFDPDVDTSCLYTVYDVYDGFYDNVCDETQIYDNSYELKISDVLLITSKDLYEIAALASILQKTTCPIKEVISLLKKVILCNSSIKLYTLNKASAEQIDVFMTSKDPSNEYMRIVTLL